MTSEAAPVTGPLTGLRVVVLAGLGPGPFTSMMLADMGADVVRIARPTSRPARPVGHDMERRLGRDPLNRGVTTTAVDLKDPEGLEAVLRLSETADVFVEGFRPGVTERMGLGPDVLLAHNPALVYARLTGYGQTGPLARTAGHDINYVAQSGALHAMARFGEIPRPPLNLLGDYAGGGMIAAFGIVCAVLQARASGQGQVVDVAMLDGVALLTAKIQGLRAEGFHADVAGTNLLDSGAPFYDVYRCSDGGYLAVGAIEPDFYHEFLTGLGVETSGWPPQQDTASWPLLHSLIADVIASRPREDWTKTYAGGDACVSAVLTFEEAAVEAHNVDRHVFERIDGVLHPSPAPRFSRTPAIPPAEPVADPVDVGALQDRWARTS